jgi:cell wall-associated NlpC family hydrolase
MRKNLLPLAFLLTGFQLSLSAVAQSSTPTMEQTAKNIAINTATKAVEPLIPKHIESKATVSLQDRMMQKMTNTVRNLPLISFVNDWYYTRYRLGGTTKSGVDCSSFTLQLFQEVYNINLPRTARQQYAVTVKVEEEEMQEGDLVFFNTRGGVSHVGVYLVNGYFVHASSSRGVMVSNLNEKYFKQRFLGARRIISPLEEQTNQL